MEPPSSLPGGTDARGAFVTFANVGCHGLAGSWRDLYPRDLGLLIHCCFEPQHQPAGRHRLTLAWRSPSIALDVLVE
jgi:hypothetical protein